MSKPNPIAEKQNLIKVQESSRVSFNKAILQLINIACNKNPKEEKLLKLKEIFAAIQAIDPLIVIINAGPYIWKYREPIAKRESDFFIKNTFTEDVSEYYKEPLEHQDFSADDVSNIMKSLKSIWQTLSVPEQTVIWTHAGGLLTSYAQYVSCEKQIRDISLKIKNMM